MENSFMLKKKRSIRLKKKVCEKLDLKFSSVRVQCVGTQHKTSANHMPRWKEMDTR